MIGMVGFSNRKPREKIISPQKPTINKGIGGARQKEKAEPIDPAEAYSTFFR